MADLAHIIYPVLLICAFFGVIVLVGIGCAYWALIIFDKRMRRCPHCHQTGGGDITESTLIGSKNYMDFKHQPPIRVTVKSYEEHYRCQYCGHTWIRTAEETVRNLVKL